MDRDLIDAAVAGGAKGLVIAGVGDGNFTNLALAGLRDARKKGVMVVRSTRVAGGFTTRNAEVNDDAEGFVASEEFKPSKARVVLQIALLRTPGRRNGVGAGARAAPDAHAAGGVLTPAAS
jgi:L-asparaginase